MSQFNPGDVCIVVSSLCLSPDNRAAFVGQECTILARAKPLLPSGTCSGPYYKVELDGAVGILCSSSLRRKQPPPQLGSWATIEKLTKWNPAKTPA